MFNKFDLKYIIKKVLIGLTIAFILFNVNKCNAYALDLKDSIWSNDINSNRLTGYYSAGVEQWKDLIFNNPIDLSSYDYDFVIFRIRELTFTNSAVLLDTDNNTRCTYWSQDIQGNNVNYRCTSTASDSLQSYQYPPIDTTVSIYITDTNGYGVTCYFTADLKDHIVCPKINNGTDWHNINAMHLIINTLSSSSNTTIQFAFRIDQTIYFGNSESTDIINGLTGIQNQQTQTNTIIQDSNTSSSQSSANTGINSMNTQITQQVDSLASVNTYNTIINNFFTQINNSTCSPISLPMPFVNNQNIVLPCIGTEINNNAPTLWTFWRFLCAGIIGFALWGNLIAFIKGVVDPYNIGANNLPLGGGK